ncbi:M42 family metallopeptidase [Erysipelothrix urinaevulpis]|uniref:M42 family metallopeptidase n=1 Tax=Erysipelothrix urinaevulpis TaxID=2683717 RepID=UPI00135A53BA|nr:M42 family metallopeptidase [Erysipelothrix urinaevulpis]
MLNKQQLTWFKELTQIDGVSGHEHEVARYLEKEYGKYTDEIIRDNLGSIAGVKRSKKENAPKVLVLGHMDEIGFLVKDITETGVLKIHAVGGWFSQTLLAHRIRLTNRHGQKFAGTIGSIPPHMLTPAERSKPMTIDQMIVDVGAKNKDAVLAMGIQIGDMVVVQGDFVELDAGNRLLAKAFDNRYGCVMGLDLFEQLKDVELDFDLYIGASVQEEVGLRGAQTLSQMINPDFAIILDCSPANDALDQSALGKLGDGVLIRVMDGSMIANKEILYHFVDTCEKYDIDHQYYYSNGGTDAGIVHKVHDGVKTLTCCVCARNIHTSSSILDVHDYLSAQKGIVKFLTETVWGDVLA